MNLLFVSLLVLNSHACSSENIFYYSTYGDIPESADLLSRSGESIWNKVTKVDFTTRILYHLANSDLEHEEGEGNLCRNHSAAYIQALGNIELWAVQMEDSSAQSLEGLIAGNNYHLGNYDECLDIMVRETTLDLTGQYCLMQLDFHFHYNLPFSNNALNVRVFEGNTSETFHPDSYSPFSSVWDRIKRSPDPSKFPRDTVFWAVCVPSSCSPSEIEMALNNELLLINRETGINMTGHLEPNLCQTKLNAQIPLSEGDIAFSMIVGFIVLLVVVSSSLDWMESSVAEENAISWRILFCFSAKRNLKFLSSGDLAGSGFDAIHGLRLLYMILAIAGHRFLVNFGGPLLSVKVAEEGYRDPSNMYILNGMIVVDTFFVYSGCLTAYYLPLELEKREINPFLIWVYRFIRLTPVYFTVLIFHATLLNHLGNGPLWPKTVGLEATRCETNWWTNLLYLNNYINAADMCMFQTWYLAVDTHLFMIAVLIVYLMWKKPIIGYIAFAAAAVLSILVPFVITYTLDASAFLLLYRKQFEDPVTGYYFQKMYAASHIRGGPYVVGVATGFLLYKLRNTDVHVPKVFRYLGHIAAAFFCLVAQYSGFVFYSPTVENTAIESASYNALHRTVWGIGIALNIFLLVRGRIDWGHKILTWAPLVPVSRLTYCAYLLHTVTHLYELGTLRSPKFNSFYLGTWMFISDIIITFLFSLVLNLTIEAPFRAMEKSLLGRKREHDGKRPGLQLTTKSPEKSTNIEV